MYEPNQGVPMNIVAYICRRYIPWFLHWLTEEYDVYSSVMKVCSSVITDEHVCVSCSDSSRYEHQDSVQATHG
jgi:hypothetical protein